MRIGAPEIAQRSGHDNDQAPSNVQRRNAFGMILLVSAGVGADAEVAMGGIGFRTGVSMSCGGSAREEQRSGY
jgi:hypothetical protein